MPQLKFEDFITCFKKQFLLQKGKGGHRISPYYTNYNAEQHLKNDLWGIMVFIYTGSMFGFSDTEMRKELKIGKSLYEELKDVVPDVIHKDYPDVKLRQKVLVKIGLVKNCVYANHRVYMMPKELTLI